MILDEEFKRLFYVAETDLQKIKLAIKYGRVRIINRQDKSNLPAAYLIPILHLPDTHPVAKAPRKSGGAGSKLVLEMRYFMNMRGQKVLIYFKGFFTSGDRLTLLLTVQSLRDNSVE